MSIRHHLTACLLKIYVLTLLGVSLLAFVLIMGWQEIDISDKQHSVLSSVKVLLTLIKQIRSV